MVSRLTPYGYKIKNGVPVIIPERAAVIQRIYHAYMTGESFQKISDTLNDESIPFDGITPVWDYNKVRCVLRSKKYAGTREYPAIIDAETFKKVQEILQRKSMKCTPRPRERIALELKPYLYCQNCKARLEKTKSKKNQPHDAIHFMCTGCRARIMIGDNELLDGVCEQIKEHYMPTDPPSYIQSDEVVRLTNAINRKLEQPNDPDEVIDLILQGISARYNCWTDSGSLNPDNYRAEERVRKNISRAVSYITIAPDKTIQVYFKE